MTKRSGVCFRDSEPPHPTLSPLGRAFAPEKLLGHGLLKRRVRCFLRPRPHSRHPGLDPGSIFFLLAALAAKKKVDAGSSPA
jgi:hypothetical protein